MTKTTSAIEEILDIAGLDEVACRRTDLEGGYGEMWDITLPDEQATVRLFNDDGQINVIVFVRGRSMIIDGEMKFSHALAAPTYVAAALEQIIADYS